MLLLGLKGSGKTTYLAALWHLLEAGEAPAALALDALQPDREYLNRIRDNWLAFEEVGRTPIRGAETVSLVLRDRHKNSTAEVTIPDLSGESFRLQWAMRKTQRAYAEYVSQCTGLLLFTHPNAAHRSPLITPTERLSKLPGPPGPASPWTAADSPVQVQLVELIQFVLHLRNISGPLPIAIIVSAWDLIRAPQIPAAWFDARLPLLAQFLRANSRNLPSRIFGVSAVGGDLNEDRARLTAETVPAKRIRILEDSLNHTNDLTAPLRFVLQTAADIVTMKIDGK